MKCIAIFASLATFFISSSEASTLHVAFENGYYWQFEIVNGEAQIGGLSSSVLLQYGGRLKLGDPPQGTSVEIPSTLWGYPVTCVPGKGGRASIFYTCGAVTIPNSVLTLSDNAFSCCSLFPSITIPNSVTTIGHGAFSHCINLAAVTIGKGVTTIGGSAFCGCSSLASVAVPDSVISLGDGAFGGCSSLAAVTIGKGVTTIGGSAFSGCSSLASVAVPDSVISLGDYAFSGCSSLAAVTIGKGLEIIGGAAFKDCSSLPSITIPDSVTRIVGNTFTGCSKLSDVYFRGKPPPILQNDNYSLGCPSGTIGWYLPEYADEWNAVIGTDGKWRGLTMKELGEAKHTPILFLHGWNSDSSIWNPMKQLLKDNNGYSEEELWAPDYWGSRDLDWWDDFDVTIEEYAEIVANEILSSGKTVDVVAHSMGGLVVREIIRSHPAAAVKIRRVVTLGTPHYGQSGELGTSAEQMRYGSSFLYGLAQDWVSRKGSWSSRFLCIAGDRGDGWDGLVDGWSAALDGVPVRYVRRIHSGHQSGAPVIHACVDGENDPVYRAVAEFLVNGKVLPTGTSGFVSAPVRGGSIFFQVVDKDGNPVSYGGTETRDSQMFVREVSDANEGFAEHHGEYGLLSDGDANSNLEGIGQLTGPRNNEASSSLFSSYHGLPAGTYTLSFSASNDEKIGPFTFGGITVENNKTTVVQIPAPQGTDDVTEWHCRIVDDCATITGASPASGNLIVPSTLRGYPVTSIGDRALQNCSALASVEIPAGVTSIGEDAFDGCSGLTAVSIPATVASIGDWAFCNCSSLASIAIPGSVRSIGLGAFYGCRKLTTVTIPNGVTKIEDVTFEFCSSLSSVSLPDSIESVGVEAFWCCSSLPSIALPAKVKKIGLLAFNNCISMSSISVDAKNPFFSGRDGVLFSKDGKTLVVFPAGKTGTYSIPEGVTTVAPGAFSSAQISEIHIPSSLTRFEIDQSWTYAGLYTAPNCNDVAAFRVDSGNRSFSSVDGVLFSKDGKTLLWYPSKKSGTEYDIPNGVTFIGDYAFSSFGRPWEKITIPDSVKKIGAGAFFQCLLDSISIPHGVTEIGERAFFKCDFEELVIPASVTSIGENAFQMDFLRKLTLPEHFRGKTGDMGIPEGCEVVFYSVPLSPVYRFYSPRTRGHFFTINEAEKDNLIATASHIWNYEGIAYYAYKQQVAGTVPLYRFYAPGAKGHFYTRNEGEKNNLIATASRTWNYEGIAYYVAAAATSGTTPIYRFWAPGAKHHFYTRNEGEKNNLIATASHIWNYEGIAFHAWPSRTPAATAKAVAKAAVEGGREEEDWTRETSGTRGTSAANGTEGTSEIGGTGVALYADGTRVPRKGALELTGGVRVEVRTESPNAEELAEASGNDGEAVALTLALPDGPRAVRFWSATDGVLADEPAAEGEVGLKLPANGVWHWLFVRPHEEDETAEEESVWLRAE